MTTPLFFDKPGQSKVDTLLIGCAGESRGLHEFIFSDEIKKKVDVGSPGVFDPAKSKRVEELFLKRSGVAWDKGDFAFIPGPGCYGRLVVLHYGWVQPGHEVPNEASKFSQLDGYTVKVFGGNGAMNFDREWTPIPFSTSRRKMIKSADIQINSPMKLVWWLSTEDVEERKGTGDLFFLRIVGTMETFGQLG